MLYVKLVHNEQLLESGFFARQEEASYLLSPGSSNEVAVKCPSEKEIGQA